MSKLVQVIRWLRPNLHVRTLHGQPITVGERQITPVARSVAFSLGRPGGPVAFGFARTHPVAVLETWHGHTRRIGIPNLTRRIVLAALATGFLLTLTVRLANTPKDRQVSYGPGNSRATRR